MQSTRIDVTDMFCGAGGSSQGMAAAGLEIKQAMNHWKLAVESHNHNFPNTLHDVADVSQADPRRYHSTMFLWASPECTNHTVAKGVRRRSAQLCLLGECEDDPAAVRSRATMWDPIRFAEYHSYPFVIIENVVDARKWRLFDSWLHAWRNLGYEHEIVYLNSMFAHVRPLDAPTQDEYAPQSRDRMYVVLWKKGNPRPNLDIRPAAYCQHCAQNVEAVQSWKRPTFRWGRYGKQYVYRCPICAQTVEPYRYAAFNAIDWSLPTPRIGDRSRPLKNRTLKRIEAGLKRYGNQHLIVDVAFAGENGRAYPVIYSTAPTQTGRQTIALINPFILGYANGDGPAKSITEALRTIHTENGQALVMPMPWLAQFRNNMDAQSMDDSLTTLTGGGRHHALIVPSAFLTSYYSGSNQNKSVDDAAATITAHARHALVASAKSIDDCGFRMLAPHEIGAGMGFGRDYVVLGNNREKVRQYGNAVTPVVPNLLAQRCIDTLQ